MNIALFLLLDLLACFAIVFLLMPGKPGGRKRPPTPPWPRT